ncbi:MAG: hypothetical protein SGJ19_29185 [Planctomycetia bacterium]|nr:hypothetical protein [Planctomycetia bacterium]
MQALDGELLIGGERLAHLSCELDEDRCTGRAHEWRLAGRLTLSTEEQSLLVLERVYRLQLADGRAGQIVVTHFATGNSHAVVAEFHHSASVRRPK